MSRWFNTYGFAEVANGLLVGALPADRGDVRKLSALEVTRVLNLVSDEEYRRGARRRVEAALADAGIAEVRFPCIDYGSLDELTLERSTAQISQWLDDGETVYLHCRAGWQRSATVAAGVIALRYDVGPEQALDEVKARKPTADPLAHQREDLGRWWQARSAE